MPWRGYFVPGSPVPYLLPDCHKVSSFAPTTTSWPCYSAPIQPTPCNRGLNPIQQACVHLSSWVDSALGFFSQRYKADNVKWSVSVYSRVKGLARCFIHFRTWLLWSWGQSLVVGVFDLHVALGSIHCSIKENQRHKILVLDAPLFSIPHCYNYLGSLHFPAPVLVTTIYPSYTR